MMRFTKEIDAVEAASEAAATTGKTHSVIKSNVGHEDGIPRYYVEDDDAPFIRNGETLIRTVKPVERK